MTDARDLAAFAAAWDAVVRRALPPGERLTQTAAKARSVLRPGASPQAIGAAEARLGVTLPPSYRAFLALSDGAYADPHGPVTSAEAKARQHTSVPGLGLLAGVDLCRLDEAEPQVVAAMLTDSRPGGPLPDDGRPVLDVRPLSEGRAILVTSTFDGQLAALVPVGDDPDWQLWVFTRDEIIGYRSFGSWLRAAAHEPGVEAVMDLIRYAVSNDPRFEPLYKVRDPATLPYLMAALDEFPDRGSLNLAVMGAMSNMGSDTVVELLESRFCGHKRELERRHAIRALAKIGSPAARDSLARCEDWENLARLGDPRASELAVRSLARGEIAAASYLSVLGENPSFIPALHAAMASATDSGAQYALAVALYGCGQAIGRAALERIAADPASPRREKAARRLR